MNGRREIRIKLLTFLDRIFYKLLSLNALLIVILLLAILTTLLMNSMPSIKKFGYMFLFGKDWDPYFNKFGALPFVVSTLITSFLALLISLPFTLSLSVLLGEYYTRGRVSALIKLAVETLAGIPSVIYGFWGLLVLAPKVQIVEAALKVESYGVGILTASLILAIMIIPYATSIGRDVISWVPMDLKEAGYSLGATRFEVLKRIILPYARSGILAGIVLSLGRALGETMAVTMVIGNSNFIPRSLFAAANTMASVIANEFTEATGELYLSSLVHVGLWLFIITTIINIIGKFIINKITLRR